MHACIPAMVVVDSNGIFTAEISVPTQTIPGAHTIIIIDDEGASASTTFTVIDVTGPAGEDGATGATGPAGPAGADGADAPAEYLWTSLILAIIAILIAGYGIFRKTA